jgi:transposase-like protein
VSRRESTLEKVRKVKELLKQGYSLRKALREVGLSWDAWRKYKDTVEDEAGGEEPEVGGASAKPPTEVQPRGSTARRQMEYLEAVRQIEEQLRAIGIAEEDVPLIADYLKLRAALQRHVRAARAILEMEGLTAPPPPAQPQRRSPSLEDLTRLIKEYEETKKQVKEALEALGFGVVERYVPREEHERILEEVRRRAYDEALDDKRIEAVKEIISTSVAKLIELFRPAVDAIFGLTPQTQQARQPQAGTGESQQQQG